MKRPIFLSLLILAIAVTEGFASDQSAVKESRDLSGFTKVNFGVSGEPVYKYWSGI